MHIHAHTEDQLVERSAIGLFAELGCNLVRNHSAIPLDALSPFRLDRQQ